ncbi:MAG TPA: hypothetical protein VLC92_14415 [Rhodocyclaceae bacterium]|nr:hypothetical protein [Rhodocyclaceae bacterium]
MKPRILKTVLISTLVTGLTACGSSVPKCSSSQAEQGIRNILFSRFNVAQLTQEEVDSNVTIKSARAESFDEGIKTYRCEGDIKIGERGGARLTYESRLDDHGEPSVVMTGLDGAQMVQLQQAMLNLRAKIRP